MYADINTVGGISACSSGKIAHTTTQSTQVDLDRQL
jgi:hypothetical protein